MDLCVSVFTLYDPCCTFFLEHCPVVHVERKIQQELILITFLSWKSNPKAVTEWWPNLILRFASIYAF